MHAYLGRRFDEAACVFWDVILKHLCLGDRWSRTAVLCRVREARGRVATTRSPHLTTRTASDRGQVSGPNGRAYLSQTGAPIAHYYRPFNNSANFFWIYMYIIFNRFCCCLLGLNASATARFTGADPGFLKWGGGGSRRGYKIFHKHPPPPWTLSA